MAAHKLLFFVLVLAVCLTQFASDIYAPSLPAIALGLHTSISLSQKSLAIFLFGVAFSELIYGPLSEGIGRKIPIVMGLIIMLMGSILCSLATSIDMLITGRLIQGFGAGACAALWRSIFRDVFVGDDLAKYGSYLVIFIMFIVPAAPALGGYLQEYFGWRASFIFMTAYTLLALVLIIYGLTETNSYQDHKKLTVSFITQHYWIMLSSPIFMGITFCAFLGYGAFFSWFTVGPVLLIHQLGLSPVVFGWITCLGGGGAYALAGWLNGRFVKKFGMHKMLRVGFFIMLLSGIFMWLGYRYFGVNLYSIVIPVILFYFGTTLLWPNAYAIAFTPFGHIAGYAGALYGFMQLCGGAVISSLVSYLPSDNQRPLALIIIITSMMGWIVFEKVKSNVFVNHEMS